MHTYKLDQIDGAIVAVAKDANRLQDKIHAIGFAILRGWGLKQETPDWAAERLSNLQAASPYHADAFSKWVAKHLEGYMVWNTEEEKWVAHAKNFPNKQQAETLLKNAKAEPFYKLKPAKAPKPYNDLEAFLKFAENLEAKNKKAAEKPEVEVHPAFVNEVRKLVTKVAEMQAA